MNDIITPKTNPDHPVVGHYFGGYNYATKGTVIYYCDSYDPRLGYWLTNVKDKKDRRNVSEAAINRTFHEARDVGTHWWVTTWSVQVLK